MSNLHKVDDMATQKVVQTPSPIQSKIKSFNFRTTIYK